MRTASLRLIALSISVGILVAPANAAEQNIENIVSDIFKKITAPIVKLASSYDEVLLPSFLLLSQKNPGSYRSPDFMLVEDGISEDGTKKTRIENLACLATVYVMLARGTGKKAAVVEDYYADPRKYGGNGPGAIKPQSVKEEAAIDSKLLLEAIDRGEPVILHGKGGPLNNHFVLVTGYRKYSSGDIEIIANDPWPEASNGAYIYLPLAANSSLTHPTLNQIEFSGMRLTGISSSQMSVNRSDQGPCEVRRADLQGKYIGNCRNGLAEGSGVAEGKSKSFTGLFSKGLPHAKGEFKANSAPYAGATISGNFVDGYIVGKGRIMFADGGVYEGALTNERPNGKGRFTRPGAFEYEGDFQDGKMAGKGTLVTSEGTKYTGGFLGGKYSGYGVMTYTNGEKYDGQWVDGQKHGKGKVVRVGQKPALVEYVNGQLVGPNSGAGSVAMQKSGGGEVGQNRNVTASNVAEEFSRDPTAAIQKYANWQAVTFPVTSIEARQGWVSISGVQVPSSTAQEAQQIGKKPFSWDDFHRTAVQGNNIYARAHDIECLVEMKEFAKMKVSKGTTLQIQAKLERYDDGGGMGRSRVTFVCK